MNDIEPIGLAQSAAEIQTVSQTLVINALKLDARIGVYESEQLAPQPIVLWVEATLAEPTFSATDAHEDVVCYGVLVQHITQIVNQGHTNLVETLIQKIADRLFENKQIQQLKIRIEKTTAISNANGVGIECSFSRRPLTR